MRKVVGLIAISFAVTACSATSSYKWVNLQEPGRYVEGDRHSCKLEARNRMAMEEAAQAAKAPVVCRGYGGYGSYTATCTPGPRYGSAATAFLGGFNQAAQEHGFFEECMVARGWGKERNVETQRAVSQPSPSLQPERPPQAPLPLAGSESLSFGRPAMLQPPVSTGGANSASDFVCRKTGRTQDVEWDEARKADTVGAYRRYIEVCSPAKYLTESIDRIAAKAEGGRALFKGSEEPKVGASISQEKVGRLESRSLAKKPESIEREPLSHGQEFRDSLSDGSVGPEMIVIPPGTFRMGDQSAKHGRGRHGPVHHVAIAKPIAVGKYEVTFSEFEKFCMASGRVCPDDAGFGRDQRPLVSVSWSDARDYTNWLSAQTGKPYRLLSEAEWEYAARANSSGNFWWGNDSSQEYQNVSGSGVLNLLLISHIEKGRDKWPYTAPVGSFPRNPLGLYDMDGNVSEWVQDCANNLSGLFTTSGYDGAPVDGSAWLEKNCDRRIARGASWNSTPDTTEVWWRFLYAVDDTRPWVGFRVARDLTDNNLPLKETRVFQ